MSGRPPKDPAKTFYHGKPCVEGHGTLRYSANRGCVVCHNEKARQWQKNNPEVVRQTWRKHDLKRNFGLSIEEYEQMLSAQDGVCAICFKPPTKRRLAVDHDHKSGAVRALLCSGCNHILGNSQDNPELLRRAATYLETHSRKANHGDQ